jgi:hypothetical protein
MRRVSDEEHAYVSAPTGTRMDTSRRRRLALPVVTSAGAIAARPTRDPARTSPVRDHVPFFPEAAMQEVTSFAPRFRILAALTAVALAALPSALAAQAPSGARLTGTIVTDAGQRPIPAAQTRAWHDHRLDLTGDDGRFAIANVPAGRQIIDVPHQVRRIVRARSKSSPASRSRSTFRSRNAPSRSTRSW